MKRCGQLDSFEEEKAAARSLLRARDGDPSILNARIKDGSATPEEYAFPGSPLDPNGRRPKHRPRSVQVQLKQELVASFLRAAIRESGWKVEAVIAYAMDRYGIARSLAFKILAKVRSEKARIEIEPGPNDDMDFEEFVTLQGRELLERP
jgi:hypothetical protein